MILFFSGTGNSLKIAKSTASLLGDTKVVSIAYLRKENNLSLHDETIVIVFPVYSFGVPKLVYDFFSRKIDLRAENFYAIASCGGTPGYVNLQLKELLSSQGHELKAGFVITEWDKYFGRFDQKIAAAADYIGKRKSGLFEASNSLMNAISPFIYHGFYRGVNKMDRRFRTNHACTKCGLCIHICPVDNIEMMKSGKPAWKHNCQMCTACLQYCPNRAVEYTWISRYAPKFLFNNNKDISPTELIKQKHGYL